MTMRMHDAITLELQDCPAAFLLYSDIRSTLSFYGGIL